MILFWFRRDLRIGDNVGLYNALNSGKKVLPVFVFDKNILKKIPKSDSRIDFIYKNLQKMQLEFYKYGSSILVAKGNPIELIPKWCEKYKVESVYTNEDYEPYARKRDLEISEKLSDNGVKFKSFKDQVIFAPNEVLKKDGTPYKVYTPFSKLWISKLESEDIKEYSTINLLNNLHKIPLPNIPTLEEIGFIKSEIKPIEPTYSSDLIDKYDSVRNYPSINGTSRIGVHLRFGTISIRKMVSKAKKSVINTFLKELIWREFFMHILWHFPKTIHSSFKPQYDKIDWFEKSISTLSQGQKHLVCLLSVLLMKPKILLLDEPFTGIDIPTKLKLEQYLSSLKQTIIHVSHVPETFENYQRLIWIDKGIVQADGIPKSIIKKYRDAMNNYVEKNV